MPPRTPLLRPDRFFAERELNGLRLLVVAVVLVFSVPVAVSGVGWIVTERVDGTVMVDNPNRPPEAFCQGAPDSMDAGCDAPAEVERDVDGPINDAMGQFMGPALLGFPIVLLLVGLALHAGSWLADGTNGAVRSFAVALWGLAPSLVGLVLALAVMWLVYDPLTVTPETDPSVLVEHTRWELQPLLRWGPVVSGLTTLWGAIIWRYGLVEERGLPGTEASVVAGVTAVLFWGLSLV